MSAAATIYALSSAPGRAGVAVIRVSGDRAGDAILALARTRPAARQASVRVLTDPGSGAVLDQALVLWFPGPHSFTGEDCAEFHVHGGRAVVAGVLDALGAVDGLAMAEPGAFTRRAFEHGRIDLTEAEGLADLIDAETEAQRVQALRQMTGGLGQVAEGWRQDVVTAMGLMEASIDFSDEADVTERTVGEAKAIVKRLDRTLGQVLADGRRGEILRDGFRVVIAGPPNAGKSSLINALSRRDVAIVSDEPGTTRDVVEARLDLQGIPVLFMDTAGLREAPGAVEREGIRRALERAETADLVLWLIDATAPVVALPADLADLVAPVWRVVNKVDAVAGASALGGDLTLSARTGVGVPGLIVRIAALAGATGPQGNDPLITRVRHRQLIGEAHGACRAFLDGDLTEAELRAEDLRRAAHALGQLTGRVDVEEVLGEIFGRFCIGK